MNEPIIKKEDKLRHKAGMLKIYTGALVLTTNTLSFVTHNKATLIIPVQSIISVNTKKGIGAGTDQLILIYDAEGKEKQAKIERFSFMEYSTLGALSRLGGSHFASWEEAINKVRFEASQTSTGNGIEDLEKLAELKEKGVITEEDFVAKKKQILGL